MGIEELGVLFTFIGGIGLFLYGMNIMGDGLQKSAGDQLKKLMGILTKTPLKGTIVGALVTAIIQSSGATTVMVVGFVNAGIITLNQACGVIMGANIGTTMTSWLVSLSEWGNVLSPEFIAPLLLGIGAFLFVFCKGEKKRYVGEIILGFGALFMGLGFMSSAIEPFKDAPIFYQAFQMLGKSPILAMLVGLVVTAIMQSSSASVGILQTLAMNGVVNWNSAVFIAMGQNIGSCVTAMISSIGANRTAKRAAVIHLMFNVIGAVFFGCLAYAYFTIFNRALALAPISSVQISIFHSCFNVANTCLLFPFASKLVDLSGLLVKETEEKEEEQEYTAHLDNRVLVGSPAFAIETLKDEVVRMASYVIESLEISHRALVSQDDQKIEKIKDNQVLVKQIKDDCARYIVEMNALSLSVSQEVMIKNLANALVDLERIANLCRGLATAGERMANKNMNFSIGAKEELSTLSKEATETLALALDAMIHQDYSLMNESHRHERIIDDLESEYRYKYLHRSISEQEMESYVILLDAFASYERISDHAWNVAKYARYSI